jgi:hypothetical protein
MTNGEVFVRYRTYLSGREQERIIRRKLRVMGECGFSEPGVLWVLGDNYATEWATVEIKGHLSKLRRRGNLWEVRIEWAIHRTFATAVAMVTGSAANPATLLMSMILKEMRDTVQHDLLVCLDAIHEETVQG